MEELAGDALRRVGSLRVAWDDREARDLRSEYEALRADGFDADWLEPYGRFPAALRHPRDGSLDPGRWIRRLAARAGEAGADIREHARVESLDELDAEQVVIATDGLTRGLVPALDDAIRPVRNQVVVTEPLTEEVYGCPHYGRRGWDYWQQLPGGRLVAGGRRDADPDAENTSDDALTEPVQRALETLVEELVDRRPAITHRWAGIFGVTADRIPYAGRVPGSDGVWVAAGYSGHGNVLGLACGELVADAILGRSRGELDLFDPARRL
jgi:glycine/D-amino acid oxidase-like deaminating enzyme